ncbi:MAG TPA: phenylpyruvate tautomerase MIF-related protein [Gammaproteobacteria bacterium]|nr:phenylpyruvate tautomerase MIF-related protein [Gammaproteobacteria bacterium]
MPYLKIQTNIPMPSKAVQDLLKKASYTVALHLGKPESYVMVAVEPSTPMLFAGTDAPLAYLELKSVGLPQAKTKELSKTLCELLGKELGIAQDRVYIEFASASGAMWGWDGGTF